MTRYLVTGGAGFIGSNLVLKLVEKGHQKIRVIDNLSTGKRENLAPVLDRIDLQLGDIREMDFVQKQLQDTEIVFHNAALSSVEQSVEDPLADYESNIGGTLNVLLAAMETGVKRVIYASSAALYGDSPTLPKHEEMPLDPLSPYALSKYAGERYCQLFYRFHGVETICLRYFNVFGPNQDPYSQYAAVIPRFISAILNGKPITIYGDGDQTRDFAFVENVVRANLLAASVEDGIGECFNISCGERMSINQLAEHLMDIMKRRVPVIHEEARPGEIRHSLADITKAARLLGYSPSIDVWEGLRRVALRAISVQAGS